MKNYLLACFLVLLAGTVVFAQERTVSGRVTDSETGEGIPGVNILIQGTTSGSVTDIDGSYTVEVPSGETTLLFSYVGYKTQAVEVGNQSTLDIALESDITALSEIVVVGYGTQEKKEITSAVASVKAEDFNQGNVQNAAQLVQGKVAGLSIAKPGGNPNAGYDVRLRGLPSIGANTQPLIVIDGVIGGTLANVDPNDIASIDVLKDGSAAAIYGTRGSSGVILVTTKSGKEGAFNVDYNGFVSIESPTRAPDVLNAEEWRDLSQEVNVGTDFLNDTNWFDEITRTATSQVHNLSMSGGTQSNTYRVSLNYRDAEGIFLNTGFDQFNARLNLTQKALNDKLTASVIVAGTYRQSDYGHDAAARYATIYNPTAPVRINDNTPLPSSYQDFDFGRWDNYFNVELFDYYNPVQILEANPNEGVDSRLNLAGKLQYEIMEGLLIDAFYSIQDDREVRNRYFDKNSYWVGENTNGRAEKDYDEFFNQLFETTANWNGDVGNNINLGVLGGYSYQEFINQGYFVGGGNFITDAFLNNNLGAAKEFNDGLGDLSSYKNSAKLIAFFGRVNVNINETFFVSASVRQEGSSRFGEENKWGTFPAISGGVELANYLGAAAIDNLKLRVSYGVTGNIPRDSYLSLQRFGVRGNFFYNGEFIPSYGPVSNANPLLQWEKKNEINVGIDFSFAGSKIYGALDWYTRKTTDLIIDFAVPVPPNLFDRTFTNIGDIRNSGLELALSINAINSPSFTWTPTITASWYLENKLVSLSNDEFQYGVRDIANMGSPGQNNTPIIRVEEGKPIGQIWGLIYEGITEDGDWIHSDIRGGGPDGNEPDGSISNEDRAVIGNGLPDFDLGFNNTFTFGRHFDLNIFFRGSFGHDLVNSYRAFYEVPLAINSYNVLSSSTDLRNPETGALLNTNSGLFSSLHVEDASFFKLDNFNFGYNVPIGAGKAVRRLRVYFGGNNTFLI
ncbi:MAG: SusC/RagA family TonB-linked outer membrane protein, partial [Cyclobacteriaceae bacterium]|nr:SusC/RagA family TonB-linked outer membrane protein [Cyclobacteriaceae bacterium]